jgi:hypothetical protein
VQVVTAFAVVMTGPRAILYVQEGEGDAVVHALATS